jgi:Protein of unknown function (DUF2439)
MAERSFSCMWSKDGAVKKHKRWSDGSAVFAGGVFTVTDGDDNKVTSTRLQQAEAAACLKPDAEFRAGSVAVQILREHQGVQGAAPAAASAASAACAASLSVSKPTGNNATGSSGSSGVIGVKRTSLGQLNRSSSGGGSGLVSSSSSSSSTLLSKGPRKPFVTPRASSISVKRVGAVPSAPASSATPTLSRPAAATSSCAAAAAASRSTADNDDDAPMIDSDGETQCHTAQQQKKPVTAAQPSTMKAPTATAPSQQQQQQQQQANSEDLVLETRSGQVLKLGMLLARQMKQHQRDGVQFMWSVLAAGSGNAQRGCILADEVSTKTIINTYN